MKILLALAITMCLCTPALSQCGLASWYGPGFHGKKTASGEIFNQNALTAAHRTVKFGTVVTVTNTENKKVVKVRINDRGPFSGNRIIDLSEAAARQLDMKNDGIVNVCIK